MNQNFQLIDLTKNDDSMASNEEVFDFDENVNYLHIAGQPKPVIHICKKILGDGSCMFRALAYLIHGDENRHLEVRKQIVDHIYNNWDKYGMLTANRYEQPYANAEAYRRDMMNPRTFGTTIEIWVASDIFDYAFEVYHNNKLYIDPKENLESRNNLKPVKRLKFSGPLSSGHFDAYIEKSQSANLNIESQSTIKLNTNYDDVLTSKLNDEIFDKNIAENCTLIQLNLLRGVREHFDRFLPSRNLLSIIVDPNRLTVFDDVTNAITEVTNLWNKVYPNHFVHIDQSIIDTNSDDLINTDSNDNVVRESKTAATTKMTTNKYENFAEIYVEVNISNIQQTKAAIENLIADDNRDKSLQKITLNSLQDALTMIAKLPSTESITITMRFNVDDIKITNVRNFLINYGDPKRIARLPEKLCRDAKNIDLTLFNNSDVSVTRAIIDLVDRCNETFIVYNLILFIEKSSLESITESAARIIDDYQMFRGDFVIIYDREHPQDTFIASSKNVATKRFYDNTNSRRSATLRRRKRIKRQRVDDDSNKNDYATDESSFEYETVRSEKFTPTMVSEKHNNMVDNVIIDDFVAVDDRDSIIKLNDKMTESTNESTNLFKKRLQKKITRRPEMPAYLQSVLVNFHTDDYLVCATNDLNGIPNVDNFKHLLQNVTRINLTSIDDNQHFFRMLEPLTYYNITDLSVNVITWFMTKAAHYFIVCADNIETMREQVRRERDPDRLVLFMIKYNFLAHYKEFIRTSLSSTALNAYRDENLIRILNLLDRKVQKKYNSIRLHFVDINYDTIQSVVVRLMLGVATI